MSCEQKMKIMNAFITSHFGYCSLIWMCHNRKINKQINKIHERALRIVYVDNTSNFDELLKRSKSVSIHNRNIQHLAIEIYKSIHSSSPTLMSEIFVEKKSNHNLRKNNALVPIRPISTKFGLNSISHLASKLWELLPEDIKNANTLSIFKRKIKSWTPEKCPCNNCREYIDGVGFIFEKF